MPMPCTVMRKSANAMLAKPRSVPRHTGLRPTQHKIALPLTVTPSAGTEEC